MFRKLVSRDIQVAADDRRLNEPGGSKQEAEARTAVGKGDGKTRAAIASGFQEGVEWMRILQSTRFDFRLHGEWIRRDPGTCTAPCLAQVFD